MTLFVKKLRCSVEYPVLGVILTGGAWDRDGGMGSSSSGSGWFQCLALYTALVGDCGKKTDKHSYTEGIFILELIPEFI